MSEAPEEIGEMVHRVAEALRAACLEEFGSTWSYDRSWKFARTAIGAMREPTFDMIEAGQVVNNLSEYADIPNHFEFLSRDEMAAAWHAMIDAALADKNTISPSKPQA